MPVEKTELLRQAGYSEGDFIPTFSTGGGDVTLTTSNDTYTTVGPNLFQPVFSSEPLFPNGQYTVILFVSDSFSNGDQLGIRLQNTTRAQTLVERQGITGSSLRLKLGPTTYTPPNTEFIETYRLQIRNSDNTTSVEIRDPIALFGVTL